MKGWTIAGLLLVALLLWIAYEYTQGSDPVSAVTSIFEDDDSSGDFDDDDSSDNSGNSGAGGNVTMTYSQQLRNLFKTWEGVGENGLLKSYLDDTGHWTIGWGSTTMPDGSPVTSNSTLDDEQEAEDLLDQKMSEYATWVNNAVKVPLNQSQFDALVGWSYNVGQEAASGSTLLALLNSGDYTGADSHFLDWVKGTVDGVKVTLGGLVTRETAITNLFNGGN